MRVAALLAVCLTFLAVFPVDAYEPGPGRRVVALPLDAGRVFISWRYEQSDGLTCKYEVKRADSAVGPFTMAGLFREGDGTSFIDSATTVGNTYHYYVTTPSGISRTIPMPAVPSGRECFVVPIRENYAVRQIALGDLNGDLLFELVVLSLAREQAPAPGGNNTTLMAEAYTMDGINIWRASLPAEYAEDTGAPRLTVWDFDSDGRDEVVVRVRHRTVVLDPATGEAVPQDEPLTGTDAADSLLGEMAGDIPVPSAGEIELYWDGGGGAELAADGRIVSPGDRKVLAGYRGTPVCAVDIAGDWREELITLDNDAIRIYTTTIPTGLRRPSPLDTLKYRLALGRGWMLRDAASDN